ncbi:MAG TPA: NAD(P)(+) transhydrogenase (Re/Si-specific) subunit beta [Gammaproteobacteria bacterium]|nr:NAD(P)(+) transhydrogenase (Re/Si-specific) subunit beta [Gammaproteobacteria bacterium]
MTLSPALLAIVYLISGCLFILGLKGLTHPTTARRGNVFAIVGMAIAILATLMDPAIASYGFIFAGIIVGGSIGTFIALKIKMTDMPQLVAALHSFVGLAAVLVAIGTFLNHRTAGTLEPELVIELGIGAFIGAITFTGSLIAFGKLQGLLSGNPVVFPYQHHLNLGLGILLLILTYSFYTTHSLGVLVLLTLIALALGFLLIIPIGGADMPVVISMLNSYSGWAAAATGFTLNSKLLIITGALVGFSGAILSYIMCHAMNRSFISVILGGFGGDADGEESAFASAAEKGVKSASPDDAAFFMTNASKIIIIPGYGMAMAQAQHALKELSKTLEALDIEVKYAIHPVAGRMPGHMNVLLAEADIPYDSVLEMDEINPEFATTDVALVVGANDITNPAAELDKTSPIYGMPILQCSKAKQVFVIKRSMNTGYAGVDNLLYYMDNCSLVFGDAKEVVENLVLSIKES